MAIGGTTLYIHGSRIAVVPFCRQVDTIFSVFESVEIFSVGVSDATLGKAIVTSMGKSREDVGSKSECLDLDDFAKLFGERSIGGFEKRSGMVGINFSDGQLIACTWHRNGRRGWRAGTELYLPVDTDAEELARICRQELNGSLSHSLSEA